MQIERSRLEENAYKVRKHVLDMAKDGGCFVGAAFSCVDILVYLYDRFLSVSRDQLHSFSRDYLIMSKGHAVPALYGTLIEKGILLKDQLNHEAGPCEGRLYLHPDRRLPGVEFYSGSLGHGLPLAVGLAMDCKFRGYKNRIVVLTGDGELNEGSNWEALLVAKAYKLDNLLVIIDRNQFQANCKTEALIPLEPLYMKLESFGCAVKEADGHSFTELENALADFPFAAGKPGALIARTLRGKGVSEWEDIPDSWFLSLDDSQVLTYKDELQKV